jgi:hypothetical protein
MQLVCFFAVLGVGPLRARGNPFSWCSNYSSPEIRSRDKNIPPTNVFCVVRMMPALRRGPLHDAEMTRTEDAHE